MTGLNRAESSLPLATHSRFFSCRGSSPLFRVAKHMSSAPTTLMQFSRTAGVCAASCRGNRPASSFRRSRTPCSECSSREIASTSSRASRTSRTKPLRASETLAISLPSAMQSAVIDLLTQEGSKRKRRDVSQAASPRQGSRQPDDDVQVLHYPLMRRSSQEQEFMKRSR